MKNEIINHLTWVVNRLCTKPIWSGTWEKDEVWGQFYKSLKSHLDITKLTLDEAKGYRFCRWDENSNLWLFPLWVVPLIPEGLMVTSISGETFPFDSTTDLDTRFGCVAFGLRFDDEKPVISYGK